MDQALIRNNRSNEHNQGENHKEDAFPEIFPPWKLYHECTGLFGILFGWIKMDSVQDCIWIAAEKSSNYITVGDVHRIEQENALSEDKTAFVAWQEREEEVFVDELQPNSL